MRTGGIRGHVIVVQSLNIVRIYVHVCSGFFIFRFIEPIFSSVSTHLCSRVQSVCLNNHHSIFARFFLPILASIAVSSDHIYHTAMALSPPRSRVSGSARLQNFTFSELQEATHRFPHYALLGEGGFGRVYQGFVDSKGGGEKQAVAIKILDTEGLQGHKEWMVRITAHTCRMFRSCSYAFTADISFAIFALLCFCAVSCVGEQLLL